MQDNDIHNMDEENFLPGLEKKNSFAVPVNYFSESQNLLEYRYELSLLPELNAVKKTSPGKVPADYFAALDEKILDRMQQADELKELGTLYAIDKKNNFAVTPGYFDEVADRVKEKYHAADQPRVGVFEQVWQFLFQPKIAASFGLVLVAGMALLWSGDHKTEIAPGDCKTLACLEKNELLNEQTIRDFDDENLYEMVDVESLDRQLSGTTDSVAVKAADSSTTDKE